MYKFEVGAIVKVLDKPNWPDGGYQISNWEGTVVQIIEDPARYVMMKADKTGYDMLFHKKETEKINWLTIKPRKRCTEILINRKELVLIRGDITEQTTDAIVNVEKSFRMSKSDLSPSSVSP
jgi:hypothetical protein